MITYSVDFSSDITESFFKNMERLTDDKFVTRKRLTEITVELLQNITKHGIASGPQTLIIERHSTYFSVETNNLIHSNDVDALKNKIQHLNKLNYYQLKKEHTHILNESRLAQKSGAGLGFYRIALRTKSALTASFTQTHQDYFIFTLHVNLAACS